MDLQPGTLLDLPFVANLVQILGIALAGAAVLTGGLVIICLAGECERLRRSMHRLEHPRARAR